MKTTVIIRLPDIRLILAASLQLYLSLGLSPYHAITEMMELIALHIDILDSIQTLESVE